MASTNGGNIKFGILFQANKTGLNLITKSLQAIQTLASKMKVGDQMYDGFQKASKAAKELESILGKSWNDKLGQLNLDKFNQSVKSSYGSVLKLKAELTGAGASGQAAFNSMASQVLNTNVQLRLSNRLLDSMATSMANTVKWGITSAIFNSITGSIQHAYNYAEQLNTSLNNIRIVTGDSADQMDRFARTANEAAKELGRSTLDYTKAAQTFYQQGLGQEEVEARTAVTLKAENITGAGSLMADYLTSVFNGFKVAAADTLGVVDKLAKVADSSASNMSLLAIAMSKVAATANVVGVDVDQLNAMLATVIATTRQAPEAVGTAYKSIFARLNDIATGAEDAEISLGNYSSKMAELGFSVLDANGNLRDTGLVLELIGARWDTLTKAQQIYLAQTMGGQRQITQVVALFDNWTKYSELLNESLSAQGTLDEKNNTYLESTAAHLKQLQAEQERTYKALFDMDTVNAAVDALRGVTDQFNDFIEGIGGGTNVFIYFGTVIANIFNKQIAQGILTAERLIERFKANLGSVEAKASVINSIKLGLTAKYAGLGKTLGNLALLMQAAAAEKVLAVQRGLTQEQQKLATIIQEQIGLTQQKITDLLEAERIRKQEILDLLKSLLLQGKSIEWIKLKASSLRLAKLLNSQTAIVINLMDYTLQDINDKTLVGVSALLKRLALALKLETQQSNLLSVWLGQNLAEEDFTKHFDAVIEGLIKGDTATKDFKLHWEAIKTVFLQVNASQNRDLATIDAYLTKIGIDTSKLTEEERARLAVLLQQNNAYAQQGKHVLNLQTAIRVMSSAGQALSAIGGALSTAFADGATAADKMNAAFSGVNGTISAALMAIPGIGFALSGVWTGVTSIGKAILLATGVWDDWTEGLKSTEEKLLDIKQREKEVALVSTTYVSSKQSIENIAEEFEALAEKRDNNIKLSEEELTRYHLLVDTITKYNSDAIQGYTSRGLAIVNNNGLILNTLSLLDKLYLKQMRNAYAGEEFKKASDTYKNRHKLARLRVEALLDESTLSNRQNQAELDFSQIRSNISGAINENYGLSNFSEDFNNALDSFIGDIGENQEDLDAYTVALENFINSLKLDENLNLDENTAITQLKDYLEGRLNELKDLAGVEGKYQDLLNLAKKELLEASQLPVKEIVGNVKVDSDQYQALKESYGDNFLQLGEGFLDNSITSFLKGLQGKIDSGQITLPEGLDDIVNWAVEQVNLYLSNFYSSYGEALGKAQQEGAKDLLKILSDETLDAADINEAIINSINENFGLLLKNVSPKDFPYLEDIIKRIYNLDSFRTVWNADGTKVVTEVKNYSTKLQEDIISAVSGGKTNSQITNLFDDLDLSTLQLEKLKLNIDTFHPRFLGFNDFKQYVLDFFKDIEDTSNTLKIIENFSKVESAINKITSGKNLSHKDKLNLQEIFGLSDEEFNKLNVRADALLIIKLKILSMKIPLGEEGGDAAVAQVLALIAVYKDLDELRKDLAKGKLDKIAPDIVSEALIGLIQKEMDALGVDTEQMLKYAQTKGKAFEGTSINNQKEILDLYKQKDAVEDLKKAYESNKDAIQDYIDGTVSLDQARDAIDQVRVAWEVLTGQDLSTDQIVSLIEKISIMSRAGISDLELLQELLSHGFSYLKQDTYEKNQLVVKNLESAVDKLENSDKIGYTGLTQEEALAIYALEQKYPELQAYQDRTADAYIEKAHEKLEVEKDVLLTLQQEAIQLALTRKLSAGEALLDSHNKIVENNATISETLSDSSAMANVFTQPDSLGTLVNDRTKLLLLAKLTVRLREKELDYAKQIKQALVERIQLSSQDNKPFELDADVSKESLLQMKLYIAANTLEFDEFTKHILDNDKALSEYAQSILRYSSAMERIPKNLSNWRSALDKTTSSLDKQLLATSEVQNAIGDLFNIDTSKLPLGFGTTTEQLNLLELAAQGDIDSFNELRTQTLEAIILNTEINTEGILESLPGLLDEIHAAEESATFTVDGYLNDGPLLDALTNMVQSVYDATGETEDAMANMQTAMDAVGYEGLISVDEQPINLNSSYTPIEVHGRAVKQGTINVPTLAGGVLGNQTVDIEGVEYTATKGTPTESTDTKAPAKVSLKNVRPTGGSGGVKRSTSPPINTGGKGGKGGGGGGGGSGSQPTGTAKKGSKVKKSQKDPYHDINKKIETLAKNYDTVNKNRAKLAKGDDIKKALKDELDLLQQQIDAYNIKQKIAERLLKNYKQANKLGKVYKTKYNDKKNKISKSSLIKLFDENDNIIGDNFDKLIANREKIYNQAIKDYNKLKKAAEKKGINGKLSKTLADKFNKRLNKLNTEKTAIENLKKWKLEYEEHQLTLEDTKKSRLDLEDTIAEAKILNFKVTIDLTLLTKEAQKEYNQFRKKIVEGFNDDNILGNAKLSLWDYDALGKALKDLSIQISLTAKEYEKIINGGLGSVYGKDAAKAKEDLDKYATLGMQSLMNMKDLAQSLKDSLYDSIDALKDAYNYQSESYGYINDLLLHNINLITLRYGLHNYDAMAGYYKAIELNENNHIAALIKENLMWQQEVLNQLKAMEGMDKNSQEWELANKLYQKYYANWKDSLNLLNSSVESALQNLLAKYANSVNQIFADWVKNLSGFSSFGAVGELWLLINKQSLMYLDNINAAYEIEKLENAYKEAIDNNANNLSAQKSLNDMMEEELKYLREKDRLSQYDVDRANALLNIEIKRLSLEQARQSKTKLRLRRDSQGNYTYQYTADLDNVKKARQELLDALNDLYNKTRDAYIKNLNDYYSYLNEWQDKVKALYLDETISAEEKLLKKAIYADHYGAIISSLTTDNLRYKRLVLEDTIVNAERLYGLDESNFSNMTYQERIKTLELNSYRDTLARGLTDTLKGYYDKDLGYFKLDADAVLAIIRAAEGENGWKINLSKETISKLNKLYGKNLLNFDVMATGGTTGEKNIKGIWDSTLQSMVDKIQELGGFEKVANQVYDNIIQKTKDYLKSISTLEGTAGIKLGEIKLKFEEVGTSTDNDKTAVNQLAEALSGKDGKGGLTLALSNVNTQASNLVTYFTNQNTEINKLVTEALPALQSLYAKTAKSIQEAINKKAELENLNTGQKTTTTTTPITTATTSSTSNKNNGAVDIDSVATSLGQVKVVPTKVALVQTVIVNGKKETRTVWRSYDTGGYTGDWNSKDGKMAVLHEKELVLNKEDTKNILNAVSIIRTLSGNLNTMQASLSILSSSLPSNFSNESSLKQNVSIEAHFPNVSNSSEIEDAFNNLINRASQYVLGGR